MTSKSKKTEIQGPLCDDLEMYYACKINSEHPGCSLTYKIRNFTNYPIRVRSRFGYCQIIHPTDKTTGTVGDHRLEKESVWIDVEFSTKNPVESCSVNIEKNNPIDKAIHDCLNGYLYRAVEEQRASYYHRSISCTFGLCLNELKPNLGNDSYFSETLGIIIDLNTSRLSTVFLDNTLGLIGNDNPGSLDVDLGKSNYEIIHFVDNTKDFNSLWTMRNGKPSKIKSVVDNNRASGIYIYSGDLYAQAVPYTFIPICDINDDKLREYGLSYTEKELLESARTKEYVETVKNYEQQIAELLKAKDKEIIELKKTHEKELTEVKRTAEKEITEVKRTAEKEVGETKRITEKEVGEVKKNAEKEITEVKKDCEKEVTELKRIQERTLTELKRTQERELTEVKRGCEKTITEAKREQEKELDQKEKAFNKELSEKEKAFNKELSEKEKMFNEQLDDADDVIKDIQVSLKEREKGYEKLKSELYKATQKITGLETTLAEADVARIKNQKQQEKKDFNNVRKMLEMLQIGLLGLKLYGNL